MVTGVSRSLFYKLCSLAELHRCWGAALPLSRSEVPRQAPATLRLDVEMRNKWERGDEQRRADTSWHLGLGRRPRTALLGGWEAAGRLACGHVTEKFGVLGEDRIMALFKLTQVGAVFPARRPAASVTQGRRPAHCFRDVLP